MKVCNLASGSSGNLTYIENGKTKILVDIGLACRDVASRLSLLGVMPSEITGVVISHEHYDHAKGAKSFSEKYGTAIYAHKKVWPGLVNKGYYHHTGRHVIFDDENFMIGNICISPVEVSHDVPCFGFSFFDDSNKVSILTDLGCTDKRILQKIQGSKLVYLEANHDEEMLKNGKRYPYVVKKRIASDEGHLSNRASAMFISELVKLGTKQIVLSHISKENNTPELAYEYICEKLSDCGIIEGTHVKIDVATPEPGTVFKLK